MVKYHGLPGVGIIGQVGEKGEKGNSMYIGYIDNFFDGVYAPINTIVKIALRNKNTDVSNFFDKEFEIINNYLKDNLDTSFQYNDTFIKNEYNNSSIYYTGMIASTTNYGMQDICNNYLISANMFANDDTIYIEKLNSEDEDDKKEILSILIGKTKNVKIEDVKTTSEEYYNIYKFVQNDVKVLDTYVRLPFQQKDSDTTIKISITYEDYDIAKNINELNSYYESYNDKGILTNSSIYTLLLNNAEADISTKIEDDDSNKSFFKEIFNGSKSYSQATNDYNTIIDFNSGTYNVSLQNDLTYFNIFENNTYMDNSKVLKYLKNTFTLNYDNIPNSLRNNDNIFLDSKKGNAYYAIDISTLYINNDSNIKIKDEDTLSSLLNNSWQDCSNYYKQYIKNTENLLDVVVKTNYNTNNKIYWANEKNSTVYIPTTLSDKYNIGDTIYFYTELPNESEILNFSDITYYMVVITEDLLRCTPMQLLEHAILVDPFQIKILQTSYINGTNRIINNNKMGITFNNNNVDISINKYFQNSINAISNNLSNATTNIICANINNSDTNISNYIYLDNFTNIETSLDASLNIFYNSIDKSNIIKTNKIAFENIQVNKNNYIQNIELYDAICDNNIIIQYDFLKPIDELNQYVNNENITLLGIELNANNYFYNTELEDYIYGYELYLDNQLIQTNYTSSKNEILQCIISFDTLQHKIADTEEDTELYTGEYYIVVWASKINGIKYYSKFSKINITVNKNLILVDYNIIILDNDQHTKCKNNIIFNVGNVTANECNTTLKISTIDASIKITRIKINNTIINGSCSCKINNWATITKDDDNYTIDLSSNLPTKQILKNEDGKYILNNFYYKNINDVMAAYSDPVPNQENDKNANDASTKCCLYEILCNNISLPSSTNRTLNIEVEYYEDNYDKIKYYENYELVQPGFKDLRCLPNINLKLYSTFDELQNINTIENGTLCNQFKTYLDVNVTGIEETWKKCIDTNNTNSDVRISFKIENIEGDLDYQKQYVIKDNIVHRSTIKPIHCYNTDSSCENYIGLNVRYIKDNQSVYNLDNNIIEYKTYNFINSSINIIDDEIKLGKSDKNIAANYIYIDTASTTPDNPNDIINHKKYVLANPLINYKEFDNTENGLNYSISMHMNNMQTSDLDNIRFKIDYDLGNPIISNLYLRFAVTEITMKYICDNSTYTYTVKKPDNDSNAKTAIYSITDKSEQYYKFISDKLDITTNPLSYIVCDTNIENDIANIQGTNKKYGSDKQIQQNIKLYNSELYTDKNLVKTEDSSKFDNQNIRYRHLYKWNNAILKPKYFQDNIEYIEITNINPINTLKHQNNKFKMYTDDLCILDDTTYIDEINNSNLICVYNASLFNYTEQNGVNKFIYNDNYLYQNRYNQFNTQMPIYLQLNNKLNIRSKQLIDSMDIWNDEYQYAEKLSTDKVFLGKLSMYGNGYEYLKDEKDNGQYIHAIIDENTPNIDLIKSNIKKIKDNNIECLSLLETKEFNNLSIIDNENIINIHYDNDNNEYQPFNNELFRTLTYDMKMEYQYIKSNNVIPFRIVSDYDYMICRIDESPLVNQYTINEERLKQLQLKNGRYTNNMKSTAFAIPYSLLYNVYPRIAYNNDYDTINVIMLRKPCFEQDNDIYINNSDDLKNTGYNLNKHYFTLQPGQTIEDIKIPYKL